MEGILPTMLKATNVILPIEKNAIADVIITVVDSIVNITIELKNSDIDSFEAFDLLLPQIVDNYGATKEEITSSFYVLKPKCFSFWFYYKIMHDDKDTLIDLTKSILLENKVSEDEIKSISFSDKNHEHGKGIILVTIDIGYDESDGDLPKYNHRKFLEKKLEESLLVKASIDLT